MAPPVEGYLRAGVRVSGDEVYQGRRLATHQHHACIPFLGRRPTLPTEFASRVTLRACIFRELRGGFKGDPEAHGGVLSDVLADLRSVEGAH